MHHTVSFDYTHSGHGGHEPSPCPMPGFFDHEGLDGAFDSSTGVCSRLPPRADASKSPSIHVPTTDVVGDGKAYIGPTTTTSATTAGQSSSRGSGHGGGRPSSDLAFAVSADGKSTYEGLLSSSLPSVSAVGLYLEEIARLRRDLQGATSLAEHRLRVIFELQNAIPDGHRSSAKKETGRSRSKPTANMTPAVSAEKDNREGGADSRRSGVPQAHTDACDGPRVASPRLQPSTRSTAVRSATCDSRQRRSGGAGPPDTRPPPPALFPNNAGSALGSAGKAMPTIFRAAPINTIAATTTTAERRSRSLFSRNVGTGEGRLLQETGHPQLGALGPRRHSDPQTAPAASSKVEERRGSPSPNPSAPNRAIPSCNAKVGPNVAPKLAAAAAAPDRGTPLAVRGRCHAARRNTEANPSPGGKAAPAALLRLRDPNKTGNHGGCDGAESGQAHPLHCDTGLADLMQRPNQRTNATESVKNVRNLARTPSFGICGARVSAREEAVRDGTALAPAAVAPTTRGPGAHEATASSRARRLTRTLSTMSSGSQRTRTSSVFSLSHALLNGESTNSATLAQAARIGTNSCRRPEPMAADNADRAVRGSGRRRTRRADPACEAPPSRHRFCSVQERYENAQISLALLRGLILRADNSLLSVLSKYQSSPSTAAASLPTALATLRCLVMRVNPPAFAGKVEAGCLWTLATGDLAQLENAAIPGIVPALREVVVAHDWCRATCWQLFAKQGKEAGASVPFSRTGSGRAVRRAPELEGNTAEERAHGGVCLGFSALEIACMEVYANLHVLLSLAQSASVGKYVR